MKKILIITRHAVPNYGSLLQAYATQKVFNNFGYEAQILDYIPELEKPQNLYKPMLEQSKFAKNKILKFVYSLIRKPDFYRMGKKFHEFQKNLLNLTEEFNTYEELLSKCPNADIYCTGSDQVWGPIALSSYDRCYFWDFLSDKKRIISYSSSFGNAIFKNEILETYKSMLERFEFLTVREKSAVNLLNKMDITKVYQVLDPTLMLCKDEWLSLVDKSVKKKGYILVYQVHNNKKMEKYAKKLAKIKGLPLVRVSNSFAHCLRGGKFEYLPSPGKFLSLINNADYIVTDSFHATVFSLNFEKPLSIVNSGKTNTRIQSILESTGLENRQISNYDDFSQLAIEINFDDVREKLNLLGDQSLKTLECLLNDTHLR